LLRILDVSSPIIYQIAFTAKKCWLAVASLGLTALPSRSYRPVAQCENAPI